MVVCKDDHVLPLVAKVFHKVCGHVSDVVDAAAELAALAKIIDADEQGFSAASALRVLEVVAVGCSLAKLLGSRWRRGRRPRVPMGVCI